MSSFDERVQFYLRHSARIEEWAALRKEAARAVDEWLLQLAPQLEQLAASLGPDVRLHAQVAADQNYPHFRMLMPGWPERSAQPGACIALEWERRTTILRETYAPYVGVKCPKLDPLWSVLRDRDAFEAVRAKRRDRPGDHWAAWGYVSPTVAFVGAEDRYREQVLDAVAGAWRDYAPLIEAARSSGRAAP